MKRACAVCILLSTLFISQLFSLSNVVIFGPQRFNRTTGAPNEYTVQFALPAGAASPYTMHVVNGATNGSNRVSSATIKLNGSQILGPSDFNQQVGVIDRTVTLIANNVLYVRLASAPGSYLTINISGQGGITIPVLSITQPTDGFITKTSPVSVVGKVTGTTPITVKANGSLMTVSTNGVVSGQVALVEGSNIINFVATDATGGNSTVVRKVILDSKPPIVKLTSPINGLITNKTKVTVKGTVTDASKVQVTVNGKQVCIDHHDAFNALVSLAEGLNTITIVATDAAGNSTNVTRTVTRDDVPPTLTVSEPINGLVTKSSSISVKGTVSDITTVTVEVNEVTFTVDKTGSFSGTVTLKEGKNTLTIEATDAAKNSTTIKRSVIRDTTPPKLQVCTPSDNITTGDSVVTVSGKVTDCTTATVVYVSVNGGKDIPVSLQCSGLFKQKVSLSVGTNTIKITATDAAGNSTTVTRTVTRKGTTLKLIVSEPTDETITRAASILIKGTATGTGTITLKVNGTAVSIAANGSFSTSVNLVEGTNLVTITATDAAKTTFTVTRLVIKDTTPPVLIVDTPVDGLLTKDAAIAVSGTVSDSTSVSVLVNGHTTSIGMDGSFNYTLSIIEGTNVIAVVATDTMGNATTITRKIRKDTTPPTLTITTPNNGTITSADSILVTGRVIDSTTVTLTINEVPIKVNSDPANGAGGTFSGYAPLSSEGTNQVYVVATDALGNATTISRVVILDTQAPTINLTSPNDSLITNLPSVTVSGTVVDSTAITLTVNGTTVPVNIDGSFSYVIPLIAGANTITVIATDAAGNSQTQIRTVSYQSVSVPFVITNPVDGYITNTGNFNIEGKIIGDTIQRLYVSYDGNEWDISWDANGNFQLPFSLWDWNVKNTIIINAVSASGIIYSKTIHILFDSDPPSISTSLKETTYTNKPTMTITGTAEDLTSVTLTVNGKSVPVDTSGKFVCVVSLPLEYNEITIVATDAMQQSSDITLTIIRDTIPPALSLVSPKDGDSTRTGGVWVEGNVTDDNLSQLIIGQKVYRVHPDGSFRYFIILRSQDTHVVVTARDSAGNSSTETRAIINAGENYLPPDPVAVAPTLDQSVVTNVAKSTEFLYTGSNPVQLGVDSGTIEPVRVTVLRGKVIDIANAPLSGVIITLLGHPEFGVTFTRSDGMFDMAVNGGGYLTVNYEKENYFPIQRKIDVPWLDYVVVDSVVLIQADSRVTTISTLDTVQVARATVMSDKDGSRQATLVFSPNTHANMVLETGDTVALPSINVRATECTVGPQGPQAMPADLPPSVAYTYCVNLSSDEAVAAGAESVQFDKPVSFYLDNFLNFPVGIAIPAAYYDPQKGAWIGSQDGRVIKILSITNGVADIDLDGDGVAEDTSILAIHNITLQERESLAKLYAPGQTIWRVQVQHFSFWDFNLCFLKFLHDLFDFPVPDPDLKNPKPKNGDVDCGSIIQVQSQTLGQSVPICGTPLAIRYSTNRVPGKGSAYELNIPVSDSTLSPDVKGITLELLVAGKCYTQTFPAEKSISTICYWDGKDAYGRIVRGKQKATIKLGYYRETTYWVFWPPNYATEGFDFSITPPPSNSVYSFPVRFNDIVWRNRTVAIGDWDAKTQKIGGWEFENHHVYNFPFETIVQGNGKDRSASLSSSVINTVSGTVDSNSTYSDAADPTSPLAIGPDGSVYYSHMYSHKIEKRTPDGTVSVIAGTGEYGYSGDGGQATEAKVGMVQGLAVGSDGTVYFSDYGIRKIDPDGIITTIGGTGSSYEDGIPAIQARIPEPGSLALGPDGSLYVLQEAGGYYSRVRRITPNGLINAYAGTGACGFSGDSGAAVNAQLNDASGICIDQYGVLYIADTYNQRIRKVDVDGIITTIAGIGIEDDAGDGGPAIDAEIWNPYGIDVAKDGTIFFIDGYNKIRYIRPDGMILTLAGTGQYGFSGDNGAAGQAELQTVNDIKVAPNGDVYFTDCNSDWDYWMGIWASRRIRKISLAFSGYTNQQLRIATEDGSQVFVFDYDGRHLRTEDAFTGNVLYSFVYNSDGTLSAIRDIDSLVTTIERDSSGIAKAIVSPYGQRTILKIDSDSLLSAIINPANDTTRFTYADGGLMTSLTDPRLNMHTFDYDAVGRLRIDMDPAGGFKQYDRTQFYNGYEILATSAEGRKKKYKVESLTTGGVKMTNTEENGLATIKIEGRNGIDSTITSDGTITTTLYLPDPRYGMEAPLSNVTTKLPSGLTSTTSEGRVISQMTGLTISGMTDSVAINGRTYKTIWDSNQKMFTIISPEGRQSFSWTDAKGRTIKDSIPGIEATYYGYDPQGRLMTVSQAGRTASYTYDAKSYLATATDPIQRVSRFEYDSVGRITKQVLPDNHEILYTYDANGNLTTLTPPTKPAHGFDYNKVDLTTQYVPPILDSSQLSVTNYQYNKDKQILKVLRPDGGMIETIYDSVGCSTCGSPVSRPKQILFDRGALDFKYDPITGLLDTLIAPAETLSYTYNGSLPKSETWSGQVNGTVFVDYDNDMRVTSQSVNGTNAVIFQYDQDGLLTQAGDMTIIRDPDIGRITSTKLGNVVTNETYDNLDELSSYHSDYNGTPIFQTSYERDLLGRISTLTESIQGQTKVMRYSYDVVGRLENVWRNDTLISAYSYDSNGNRTVHWTPTKIDSGNYDAQDRLISYSTASGSKALYLYTPNGELKKKIVGTDTTIYAYDYFGNLTRVVMSNGDIIEYIIDGQSRRVSKKINGIVVKRWIYTDQITPVAELDSAGNVATRFIGSYMIRDGVSYQLITDYLGSVRLVIDVNTGSIAQRLDYDEYGNVLSDSNPGFQPFGYAGGLYDSKTKLVRFGTRDYETATGRWTCKDPIGFDGKQSNIYDYVLNDPLNYFDPSGLALVCIYCQCEHRMNCFDDETGKKVVDNANGYSGYGEGKNNPEKQYVEDVGPIPVGGYDIGAPYKDKKRGTGKTIMRLTKQDGTFTNNRGGFLIHGDNSGHTASHGCIILDYNTRSAIAKYGGGALYVHKTCK
jgi:RHS repeat-associated protein